MGTLETVLLVNPFIYDFAAFDCWAKPRGLLRVGEMLINNGFQVELIDCLDRHDHEMHEFSSANTNIHIPKDKKFGTGSFFHEEQQFNV